jgi:hypothetical protein
VIRFVFRWAFRLLVLAIVLAVAAVLLKDIAARSLAEQRLRRETGWDARIGKAEFSLLEPRLRLENLVLYNPAEFGGSPILDASEIFLEYHRDELARGRTRLKLLRLSVREMHIVESAAGRTNLVDLLQRVAPETLDRSGKTGASERFGGVDMLNLSVGRVRYTNLRIPGRNEESNVGLRNVIVQNVRTEQDLAAILFKVLLRAGIPVYTDSKPAPVSASRN